MRAGNQFKAEHVGAQLALFACLPGCVSRGGAHGVGLEVGERWGSAPWEWVRVLHSLHWGSWERMGTGRATSGPEWGFGCLEQNEGTDSHQTPDLCCSFLLWLVRGAFKTGPTSFFLAITDHPLNNNFLSVTTQIPTGICISSQSCHFSLLIIYLLL